MYIILSGLFFVCLNISIEAHGQGPAAVTALEQIQAVLKQDATTQAAINGMSARLSLEERRQISSVLQRDIERLRSELNSLLAQTPRTQEIAADILRLNRTLSAKQNAYLYAMSELDKLTPSAAESYANTTNPYFLMCKDAFWAPLDPIKWLAKLQKVSATLTTIGRSVGLIYLNNNPVGTGFVVGSGFIMTNRHVLEDLAKYNKQTNVWDFKGVPSIHFDREFSLGSEAGCDAPYPERKYTISVVISDGTKNNDDLAILMTDMDDDFPASLRLAKRPANAYFGNMAIAVIGYPGQPVDMTANDQEQYFRTPRTLKPIFTYKRVSAGYTDTTAVTDKGIFTHVVNTSPGNSGGPVIDLADGSVVGVHCEGRNKFLNEMGYNLGITSERAMQMLTDAKVALRRKEIVTARSLDSIVPDGTGPTLTGKGHK